MAEVYDRCLACGEYEASLGLVGVRCQKHADCPTPSRKRQVGGDHYMDHAIQVWDVVIEYNLDFFRGGALKYLLRAGSKGSKLEDLRKAAHYLEKAIEVEGAGSDE